MPSKRTKVFHIFVRLLETSNAIVKVRGKELKKYGISAGEAGILHAVHSIGSRATTADIARWSYRKPHTTTNIIKRMVKKGLLEQSSDLRQKNRLRISLTEKGKRGYEDVIKSRESIYDLFKSISDEDCTYFLMVLMKIRDKALSVTGDTIDRPFP